MTPVSTLPVFWVFLEALSEKQSAEELEATSSSFSLPLSLSLSGSGPEGHRESRENGTIKINVEMKLNYKERKTLSLSKKNSVRFFLSSLLVPTPPSSFLLFLLRALQLEEDAGRKNQRETGREAGRGRETEEQREKGREAAERKRMQMQMSTISGQRIFMS